MLSDYFKLVFGTVCFLLGLGYLYKPSLIERFLTFLRDFLLNDINQALERKKWGVFFLLIGFLFFYMGLSALLNFH